ncbi:MAG: tetratricopeptide repeat protein [Chloroflexi bacterium]|uniref:Tetratricopeptide repeat protein n=1 Tax=Candidatus Chlorohelix allophototropha TaxID=3003348 RepID=A0A8T7M6C1_9CHLR|nr:tetratricopeptide repeat protein [Chloroflexota bacterium]WJW69561.1 transglutaminase-like domain-containing protein [Chloroflexota bacterium L227-S17]
MRYTIESSIFDYEAEKIHPVPGSPLARFAEHVSRTDEEIDLIEATMIIASSEYPGLNIGYYLQRLEIMGNDIRLLLAGENDPYKCIQFINSYLFQTLGFKGNQTDYNDPRNSYLNDVLERRIGIPITLSLIYIEVGRQAGLPFEGIGLPGHFIVRYRQHAQHTTGRWEHGAESGANQQEDILLDPFNEGSILTLEDCVRLVGEIFGNPVPLVQSFLNPVSNRAFLSRMLNNLKSSYINFEDFERALAIEEFLTVLNPEDWEEIRDRGAIKNRMEHRWQAILDYQKYLRHAPDARDAVLINSQITGILKDIAINN